MIQTVFVFPGQGAQAQGMGRELYDAFAAFREVFALGSEALGLSLETLCFETPDETLSRTENAQLALFAVSMGTLRALATVPDAAAGFSLGELSALCAAGVISLTDGFKLVAERGRLMQRAADAGGGAMSAILGLDAGEIERLAGGAGAQPVNYNCPGQTVIAGTPEGVAELERRCLEKGAKRAVRLNLSGAFHTEAMRGAADALADYARGLAFSAPTLPLYCNRTAKPLPPDADLPAHLALHMTGPVLWQRSVEHLIRDGASVFVEVGQGRTLGQFVSKTDRSARVLRTDSLAAFREAAAAIGGAR